MGARWILEDDSPVRRTKKIKKTKKKTKNKKNKKVFLNSDKYKQSTGSLHLDFEYGMSDW